MTTATTRRDSSFKQVQKRVPADVVKRALGRSYPITLPAVGHSPDTEVVITIRPVIKISLRVREPEAAKRRNTALNEQLARIFDSIRRGPAELDHKTAVALSGEIYRLVREHWEREPGLPEDWEPWKAFTWAAIEGRVANPPPADWRSLMNDRHAAYGTFGITAGPGLLDAIESLPPQENAHSLEVRFGLMASWVLGRHGLEVTSASRLKLLKQVAEACLDAGWAMKRAAQGDYSPDPRASRYPPIESDLDRECTLTELFESWRVEAKPAPNTLASWRPALATLREHAQSDSAKRLTAKQVVSWKDMLVAQGLAAKTINGTYLACVRAVLAHGVRNQQLTSNVALTIGVKEKREAGTRPLPYEDSEVADLLALAAKQSNPARRWIPLLAACTGARAGELAQLWAERVRMIDGILAVELRPAEDGGTLKNVDSERTVPLHREAVEAGFLEFVAARSSGPLFYNHSREHFGRHASKGVVNHLAAWVREQPGFDNPRKAPLHAFRHWWKSEAQRAGVSAESANFIQGHKTPGVAAHYRHFTLKSLAVDMDRINIPTLELSRRHDKF